MDLKRVDRVFRILPKEERYYELFDQLAGAVVEGSELLVAGLAEGADLPKTVESLKAVERKGDDLTREIMARLQKSFVTPIDREDIFALSKALDDILDDTYSALSFAEISGARSDEHLRALAGSLVACARELHSSIDHLNDRNGISDHCARIHQIETRADGEYRDALRALFSGSPDPVDVVRRKELYQGIESAVDGCEDAANVLETIVVKNS